MNKTLTVKEFRDLGFLHEINRLILHRCGIALSVIIEGDDVKFGPIFDFREEGRALLFSKEVFSHDKINNIKNMILKNKTMRASNNCVDIEGIQYCG